jgi:excisionase family DNA binding protein
MLDQASVAAIALHVRAAVGAATRPPERITLTRSEAAATLGVSVDFFDAHIAGELRVIHIGRRRLVPVSELHRWVRENAHLVLDRPKRHGEPQPVARVKGAL